jgi:hypothetical protein
MRSKALPFLCQVLSGGVTQGLAYFGLCGGLGQELPSALALQRPRGEALLARDPKQAATRIAAAAFECVVGPRQAQHIIAVEQARPITPADRVEVQSKRRSGGRGLGPAAHRVSRVAQWSCDVCSVYGT